MKKCKLKKLMFFVLGVVLVFTLAACAVNEEVPSPLPDIAETETPPLPNETYEAEGRPVRDAEIALAGYIADMFHLSYGSWEGFNDDFTASGVVDENNAKLIWFALRMIPWDVEGDGEELSYVMDATELRTFMAEFFGLQLPLADVGEYKYDAQTGTFKFPFGEPGINPFIVIPREYIGDTGGPMTILADLVILNDHYVDIEDGVVWDPADHGVAFGTIANLTIIYDYNEDWEIFPLRIISIRYDEFDWRGAQGTYERADGLFTISFRVDVIGSDWYMDEIVFLITDNTSGESYRTDDRLRVIRRINSIMLFNIYADPEFVAFITLNADGTLTASVEMGPDFSGEYFKISDDTINIQSDGYSIEQIQRVLENSDAFDVGDFGEGNPVVIFVEQVERDRDSITLESSGQVFDLTNAVRYKVELKFKQSLEDFNVWYEIYKEADFNPFRRDGDYTILTEFYYFNDVNGEPELVFLLS